MYEGKYVRLTQAIDGEPGMVVGDVFFKVRHRVDMSQANQYEMDDWKRTSDGKVFTVPSEYRSHFEIVEG